MPSKRNSNEDEVSFDFRAAGASEELNLRRGDEKQTGNPIIDHQLELPTSHLKDHIALGLAEYLEGFRESKDKLHCFLASANAARFLGVGSIGYMETARHEVLFEHVSELLDVTDLRGRTLPVVAGIGSLYPINILELGTGVAWLRDHDDETYRRLAKEGLRSAGDLFDARLRESPHVLMGTMDVRGGITSEQVALARYVLKKYVGLGCCVLLTVSDIDMIHGGAFNTITKGIKTFDLGRF